MRLAEGEIWRLLDTGVADAATNMAIDEAIFIAHSQGLTSPTLRFYAWEPPAVSIGYAQKLEKEIDLEACRRLKVDWVRRLTGGRAVLHDREVTYSVVARADHPLMAGGILPSYRRLSEALAWGLRELGAPAELTSGRQGHAQEHTSAACFDAPSWYELSCGGRKVVGSAQARKKGVVLQHGSIVLELNAELLFQVLKFPNEALRQELKRRFKNQACGLMEIVGEKAQASQVKESIVRGFETLYGMRFVRGDLLPREQELKVELKAKYAGEAWNYGIKPV
ncbi:MAG: lipoyl(octanoyl) transferase [Clostridia bacterium]|nr:lipoyl(octanoyl) transferase [Clostridia bacterium]